MIRVEVVRMDVERILFGPPRPYVVIDLPAWPHVDNVLDFTGCDDVDEHGVPVRGITLPPDFAAAAYRVIGVTMNAAADDRGVWGEVRVA